MSPVPVWKSHFGYSLELTYGTTGLAPTIWLPQEQPPDYSDDQGIVMDEGMRQKGAQLFGAYSGVRQGAYSQLFKYYPVEAARFWPAIMGADTIGSSSNAWWQHSIALADSPYSATLYDFVPGSTVERQFAGAQMEKLEFRFERATGTATIKPSWKSAAPSSGLAETVPVYAILPSFRGWQGVFSIAGSTKVTLLAYELTLSRPVELVFAGNNSQNPVAAEVDRLDASFKLSVYGSTDGVMTDYRANTQQIVDLVMTDTAAGSSGARLELLLTKAVFTKVTPDRSGIYTRYDIEGRGIYNATDLGPLQVLSTISTSSSLST